MNIIEQLCENLKCAYIGKKIKSDKDEKDSFFCKKGKIKECGCKEAVLSYNLRVKSLGICKNCNHVIINLGKEGWKHYVKSYCCQFPYFDDVCQAPKNYVDDFVRQKLKDDKIRQDEINKNIKIDEIETKRRKEQEEKEINERNLKRLEIIRNKNSKLRKEKDKTMITID